MLFEQQLKVSKQIDHILQVFLDSDAAIRPHFHLTGPSGSGKSYLVKQRADIHQIPFMEINAAGITAEGLSGNSLAKALRKLRENWAMPNIVFVDEFDKLFLRNGETTEGFRSMVQDEFLTILESKYASVFTDYGKYEPVRIDNSLFIFAGAYSNQKISTLTELKDAGLRTEFVGRVPLVLETTEVPIEELQKHLKDVDLFKSYMKLYPRTKEVVASKGVCELLVTQQKNIPIGIRGLNSCIHQYFMRGIL